MDRSRCVASVKSGRKTRGREIEFNALHRVKSKRKVSGGGIGFGAKPGGSTLPLVV